MYRHCLERVETSKKSGFFVGLGTQLTCDVLRKPSITEYIEMLMSKVLGFILGGGGGGYVCASGCTVIQIYDLLQYSDHYMRMHWVTSDTKIICLPPPPPPHTHTQYYVLDMSSHLSYHCLTCQFRISTVLTDFRKCTCDA